MDTRTLLMVATIALVTALTRFAPFLLFPAGRKTPAYIQYLSQVLPQAVIGMLVVYCLKHVQPWRAPYALPELIALGLVVGSYVWKKNTLLSIALGTMSYMLLLHLMV